MFFIIHNHHHLHHHRNPSSLHCACLYTPYPTPSIGPSCTNPTAGQVRLWMTTHPLHHSALTPPSVWLPLHSSARERACACACLFLLPLQCENGTNAPLSPPSHPSLCPSGVSFFVRRHVQRAGCVAYGQKGRSPYLLPLTKTSPDALCLDSLLLSFPPAEA